MNTIERFSPAVFDACETEAIYNALVNAGRQELVELLKSRVLQSEAHEGYIRAARSSICDGVEMDEVPVVSQSTGGAFVMAWHWISESDLIR
jgi:hypothetical protein